MARGGRPHTIRGIRLGHQPLRSTLVTGRSCSRPPSSSATRVAPSALWTRSAARARAAAAAVRPRSRNKAAGVALAS